MYGTYLLDLFFWMATFFDPLQIISGSSHVVLALLLAKYVSVYIQASISACKVGILVSLKKY